MAGFKLRRPDGIVSIDSSYSNLALRSSGVFTTQLRSNSTANIRAYQLTIPVDQGIIAFRASKPTAILSAKKIGGEITYTFFGNGKNPDGSISDYDVEWWLFDLAQYGQRFDAVGKIIVRRPSDGQVMFDSRSKYMKVLDFFVPERSGVSAVKTRSYNTKIAIVQVNRAWGMARSAMTEGFVRDEQFSSMVWVSDGNVLSQGSQHTFYQLQQMDKTGIRFYTYGGGNEQTMVIDIANY